MPSANAMRPARALNEGRLRAPSPGDCWEYLVDCGQRGLLFWDALRQRGDNTLAHERAGYPLLLKFPYEVLIDGHDLPHPVNYSRCASFPTADQPSDATRQPVIVIDPRGGHGAGIGGFKQDSEIGESLRAGHPTYFIAFSHAPRPARLCSTSPPPKPAISKRSAHAIPKPASRW